MKFLRVWLLLLLAVLLPIRSAMGAALPCAGADLHASAYQSLMHEHAHRHGSMASGGGEHAQHAAAGHHPHEGAGQCNHCAACCAATPMPTTCAPTFAALDTPAAGFATLQACAPAFLSGGQERPPRSI